MITLAISEIIITVAVVLVILGIVAFIAAGTDNELEFTEIMACVCAVFGTGALLVGMTLAFVGR